MFTDSEIEKIKKLLHHNRKIVILTHYNPDGDAIGSSLGLSHFLEKMGLHSNVVVPNDFPKFLKWMHDSKKIIIAQYKKKQAIELIESADIIFCLDFNTPDRIGILGEFLCESKAIKILIDHHQQPYDFDFVYSDISAPATCQLIYHFIEGLNSQNLIDEKIAQCLYTGIMTDTGGFRFRSTSATTHRIIANLIDKGADPETISSNTLDNNSLSKLKLLSIILGRIEQAKNNQAAILYLKRDELKEYGFQKGDTDGFVNYGLSLWGSKVSALFMEDLYEDFIKISFRSKGNIDVNQFSRLYFNGGGHINASGGKSTKSIEETIQFFKEKIENYLD